MEWFYVTAVILSALGTILAWVAKLRWSQEFADAKNAALEAKDAELRAREAQTQSLKLEIDNLRQLSSPKVREYFLSTKQQLEEFNEVLQKELHETRTEAERLAQQVKDQAAQAELQVTDLIQELELTKGQKERLDEALTRERIASARRISHEVAQPVYAALASMEVLRRKDAQVGRTAQSDTIEYYLKKNIEMSLRMIAFLNDRIRVRESSPSYSDWPCELLSDVCRPVFTMVSFQVYDHYLRDSGEQLDARALDGFLESHTDSQRILSFASSFGERTYSILCDQRIEGITLYVDKYPIQQVFYALLGNAVKYRKEGTGLLIQLERRDASQGDLPSDILSAYFVIDVADHGIGIDPDEIETIFGASYRGRRALDGCRSPGSGQGLWICRAILRGIGGDIVLRRCHGPTVFTILIPQECAKREWVDALREIRLRTERVVQSLRKEVQ